MGRCIYGFTETLVILIKSYFLLSSYLHRRQHHIESYVSLKCSWVKSHWELQMIIPTTKWGCSIFAVVVGLGFYSEVKVGFKDRYISIKFWQIYLKQLSLFRHQCSFIYLQICILHHGLNLRKDTIGLNEAIGSDMNWSWTKEPYVLEKYNSFCT